MDIMYIFIVLVIVLTAIIKTYLNYKNKQEGWLEIKEIVINTLQEISTLSLSKDVNKETFANEIVREIFIKIKNNNLLSKEEKNYWTIETLEPICKPIILQMMAKLDSTKI